VALGLAKRDDTRSARFVVAFSKIELAAPLEITRRACRALKAEWQGGLKADIGRRGLA